MPSALSLNALGGGGGGAGIMKGKSRFWSRERERSFSFFSFFSITSCVTRERSVMIIITNLNLMERDTCFYYIKCSPNEILSTVHYSLARVVLSLSLSRSFVAAREQTTHAARIVALPRRNLLIIVARWWEMRAAPAAEIFAFPFQVAPFESKWQKIKGLSFFRERPADLFIYFTLSLLKLLERHQPVRS